MYHGQKLQTIYNTNYFDYHMDHSIQEWTN